jgi:hypothetical protein
MNQHKRQQCNAKKRWNERKQTPKSKSKHKISTAKRTTSFNNAPWFSAKNKKVGLNKMANDF